MTKKELSQLEDTLINVYGFHKSGCKTNREDYGLWKSYRENENDEHPLYQIEFRVWDWTKYPQRRDDTDECSVDIYIVASVEHRADCLLSYPMNLDDVERFAKQFYEMTKTFNLQCTIHNSQL